MPGGVDSPSALWQLLKEGRDGIRDVPAGRWDPDRWFHPDPRMPSKMYTQRGGYLDTLDLFDAAFFGISPREAMQMDPQQRLLLELAWEALENAGQVPGLLAGTNVGVFVGVSSMDYAGLPGRDTDMIDVYTNTGGALSITANRVSYAFDFRGPSFAVDTACSSSLVALHQACQSIWHGESHMALTGGVNVVLRPELGVGFCKASMLSKGGRIRSFDADADGFVRAEGGGLLLLKPAAAALADGDPIQALILATGVNSDGRTTGIFMPSEDAQAALLRSVLAQASVPARDIAYVEAHGTGTPVGDPIECAAIGSVIGVEHDPDSPCLIGSIKTNIGHLEAASGVAGTIKAVLSLTHREVPPILNFGTPSPRIPFDALKLKVVTRHTPLGNRRKPLAMAVNSFGFGGTNATIVLEEHKPLRKERREVPRAGVLPLVLSARSEESLLQLARSITGSLRDADSAALYDICHSLAFRRSRMDHRLISFGETAEQLAHNLSAMIDGEDHGAVASGKVLGDPARIAFAFAGNGSQWWGMAQALLDDEPVFRSTIETIDGHFAPLTGWSLLAELQAAEADSRLHLTEIAQPTLFAVQVGIVHVLRARGVKPDAVFGHSVGEVAAAYTAGALSLEQSVRVIYERSTSQGRTAGLGKMAALGLPVTDAEALIAPYGERLAIAGINSPNGVTLSGDATALADLGGKLEGGHTFFRLLDLDYAFHSAAMESVRDPLLQSLHGLSPSPASVRFISTVTADDLRGPEMGPAYWWENVRQPVRFQAAVDRLLDDGFDVFLEIGPHPILARYLKDCIQAHGGTAETLPTLRRDKADRNALMSAVGRCFTLGCHVDLSAFFPAPARYHALPNYPWQRERYWIEHAVGASGHPLLGDRLETADPIWNHRFDTPLLLYLQDHVVNKVALVPAAAFLEMALAAARVLHQGGHVFELDDVEFHKPIVLPEDKSPYVQLSVSEADGGFSIRSRLNRGDHAWTVNVVGKLGLAVSQNSPPPMPVSEMLARMTRHASGDSLYGQLAPKHGLKYGPAFQGVAEIWGNDTEGLVRIDVPQSIASGMEAYSLHPALLDACFQGMLGMVADVADDSTWLPVRVKRLRFHGSPRGIRYCYLRLESEGVRSKTASLRVLDAEGGCVAEIDGFRVQEVQLARSAPLATGYVWQPRYVPSPASSTIASPMPSPSVIAERLKPTVTALIDEWKRKDAHERFKQKTDVLCGAYVARAFAELGAREKPFTARSLVEEHGVLPQYEALLARFIEMLAEDGMIRGADGAWLFREGAAYPDADQLWREFAADSPNALAELLIASECGDQLATLLTGAADPLQLFAQGPLEHLYESAPITRFCNHLAREVVIELVRGWPHDRPLRVLEIGAGTGGITGYIAPVLPRSRTHYVFTDISELLLARAEARFAGYPFMQYRKLDIERDPVEQGFVAGEFDLVIGAFVMHAATDLRRSLRDVRRLLSKDGQLVLLEVHDQRRLLHLLFGLLKGWSAFTDTDLRTRSPLLEPDQWKQLLHEVGFREPVIINDAETGLAPPQSIILARNPELQVAARDESPAVSRRGWLVFVDDADGSPLGAEVARTLEEDGHHVIVVQPGLVFERLDDAHFAMALGEGDSCDELLGSLDGSGFRCDEVLYVWGCDPGLQESSDELLAHIERRSISIIALLQAMRKTRAGAMPRLWIVTSGAVSHPAYAAQAAPVHAPLWGLGRVIQNYTPCKLIDFQPGSHLAETKALLLADLRDPDKEDEILLLNGLRFVNRIHRVVLEEEGQYVDSDGTAEPPPFRLDFSSPGMLDSLHLRQVTVDEPAADKVVIRVRATALNFHDVLWVMGLLPPEAVESGFAGPGLGIECAGEIAAIGDNVTGFAVGDEVLAFGSHCLGSHVTVDAKAILRKPKHISFEEAATVPTVFLTAFYALDTLAQMQPGERLLIHGAAGGVGLAAIQLAKSKGIEIFGTAGSPQKRRFLTRMGVDHVLDSRSLAFADEILELTRGEGVDVVLNSLAGEAIYRNLKVLKPFGRFLEIGRRDHFANTKMGLRPFANNISYFGIDVDQLMQARPALAKRLFERIIQMFDENLLSPLVHRVFPISRAVDAFRHMEKGDHIGKVVISVDEKGTRVRAPERKLLQLREDATYLVAGGLGGLGSATARWMVERGARHIVLLGRKGASTPEARAAVAELEGAGARVIVETADVTRPSDLERVLQTIDHELPPLRGVVHAVLVLEDVSPFEIDREQWARVLAPKVAGAWNLHRLTLDKALDFFVMYSSAATLVGSPGQPNYVAANLFLETLAAHRRNLGLPGLAVGWGAVGDVGYVARDKEVQELLQRRGLKTMHSTTALRTLERLMLDDAVQVTVADIDWSKLFKTLRAADQPKYDEVRSQASNPSEGETVNLAQWLLEMPPHERIDKVTQLLAEKLAKILRTSASKIDVKKSILEIGVDSLMTVELATLIQKQFDVTLPVMKLIGNISLTDIATTIVNEVAIAAPGNAETSALAGAGGAEPESAAAPRGMRADQLSYSEQSKCASYRTRDAVTAEDVWFHQVGALSVRPQLDIDRLATAFQRVVDRHATLRTVYPEENGRRRRLVLPAHPRGLEVRNAESLSDSALLELLKARADEPFDLARGPLFCLELYRRGAAGDVLLMRFHEIVADGWSIMVLTEDLLTAYLLPDHLKPPTMPYAEFARLQRELVASDKGAEQLDYWRRTLRDLGPPLRLPFDRPRRPGPMLHVGTREFVVDAERLSSLARLAAANDTTRHAVLLAVFDVVLFAFTRCADLVVTTVFSGRTSADFQRTVGSFSRRAWLRAKIAEEETFEGLLKRVARSIKEGLEHQDYPASLVFDAVRPAHDSLLDQVGFSVGWPEHVDDKGFGRFMTSPSGTIAEYAGFQVESLPITHRGSLRDLQIQVHSLREWVQFQVSYNSDVFAADTIDAMTAMYQATVNAIIENPKQTLTRLVAGSSPPPVRTTIVRDAERAGIDAPR